MTRRSVARGGHSGGPWAAGAGGAGSGDSPCCTMPHDVAILLYGQAFRGDKPATNSTCPHSEAKQLNMTRSLVHHVIEPLEARGATVYLSVTESSNGRVCAAAMERLLREFGARRMDVFTHSSTGLPQTLRMALERFKQRAPRSPDKYSTVVLARHDVLWKMPLTQTNVSWTGLNFVGRCEVGRGFPSNRSRYSLKSGPAPVVPKFEAGENGTSPSDAWCGAALRAYTVGKLRACIMDQIFVLAGLWFAAFDGEVGQGACFREAMQECANTRDLSCGGHTGKHMGSTGHACFEQLVKHARVQARGRPVPIGFLTDWRPALSMSPTGGVRDPRHPVAAIGSRPCTES